MLILVLLYRLFIFLLYPVTVCLISFFSSTTKKVLIGGYFLVVGLFAYSQIGTKIRGKYTDKMTQMIEPHALSSFLSDAFYIEKTIFDGEGNTIPVSASHILAKHSESRYYSDIFDGKRDVYIKWFDEAEKIIYIDERFLSDSSVDGDVYGTPFPRIGYGLDGGEHSCVGDLHQYAVYTSFFYLPVKRSLLFVFYTCDE